MIRGVKKVTTLRERGWLGICDEMMLNARRTCTPLSATFELTPLCNFKCKMCYVRLDPDEVAPRGRLHTAEEWVGLAREAVELGLMRVCLTGGEVLTRPDFKEIYLSLVNMGLLVSVLSNGALIDDEIVSLFAEHPPVLLRFTLYGASNETYERLCCAPSGFYQVMRSLHALKDAGVPFSLSFTSTAENIDDLVKVREIAAELNAPLAVSTDLLSSARTSHCEASSLRVEEKSRFDFTPTDDQVVQARRARQVLSEHEDLFQGIFRHCKAYRTSFSVQWNGDMETCLVMSYCHCRPFEDGFAAEWKRMHEILGRLEFPHECMACEMRDDCPVCPATRASETGRPDGFPLHSCRMNYTGQTD